MAGESARGRWARYHGDPAAEGEDHDGATGWDIEPELQMATAHPGMRRLPLMHASRTPVVIAVCFALVAARLSGVHAHLEQPHDPHAQELAEHHDHGATLLVSEHDPAHFESHLSHGDFDIGAPDMTAGKLPAMPLLLALIGTVFAFLILARPRAAIRPAPYRVPIHRRRIHVLPPSQAPPLAS